MKQSKLSIEDIIDKVFLGDAYDLFEMVGEDSVDLIITSPPYWGLREYGLHHNWDLFNSIPNARTFGSETKGYGWYRNEGGVLGLEPYPEWYITHLCEILDKGKRCLKERGNLWINVGDTYFARWSSIRDSGRQGLADKGRLRRKTPMGGYRQEKQLLLIPSRFAIAMQSKGWILRNDVIWYKPNAPPRVDGDRLRLSHEHFFHFVKKPKAGRASYYYDASGTEPMQNDVLIVNAGPGDNGHTATFPRELILPRILSSSPVGGVVLDPFCGTGRSLEVAKEFGRCSIGFDKQEIYAKVSQGKVNVMTAKLRSPDKQAKDAGNYISEWFGHRVYPIVRICDAGRFNKTVSLHNAAGECPFLTETQEESTACIKNESSRGVCTISALSGGVRRDWLACPYRVIHSDIVKESCILLFGDDVFKKDMLPVAVSRLKDSGELVSFRESVDERGNGFLFFQDKLGGEISISATDSNPQMSFDVTVVEIVKSSQGYGVGRYGIIELQTMDFHGSYRAAVQNLSDALRLHKEKFHVVLQENISWAGKGIEGPNIANVFKRTFYQMMIKFKLVAEGAASGVVFCLPLSVWESWQPFLGKPAFQQDADGLWRLYMGEGDKGLGRESVTGHARCFIYVFDLMGNAAEEISPTNRIRIIEVSAEQLARHAFQKVPQTILGCITDGDSIRSRIRERLAYVWSSLI